MRRWLVVDTVCGPPCRSHQRHLLRTHLALQDGVLQDLAPADLLVLQERGDQLAVDLSRHPVAAPGLVLRPCACGAGYVLERMPAHPTTRPEG